MTKRGFLLVAVLFLTVIVLIMGLAFLGSQATRYEGAARAMEAARAAALARAGIEDARTKLEKDLRFPPPASDEQKVFTYSEDVLDFDGTYLGSYTVSLDTTYHQEPFWLIRIRSVGAVGPRGQTPVSCRAIQADLYNGPVNPPGRFHFIRWEDGADL